MTWSFLLRQLRQHAGLTLRDLAARAGTSHSTLAAYEAGRVVPSVDTLQRIIRATGHEAHIEIRPRVDAPSTALSRGDELKAALDLAEQFPARHHPTITYPPFGPQNQPEHNSHVSSTVSS